METEHQNFSLGLYICMFTSNSTNPLFLVIIFNDSWRNPSKT